MPEVEGVRQLWKVGDLRQEPCLQMVQRRNYNWARAKANSEGHDIPLTVRVEGQPCQLQTPCSLSHSVVKRNDTVTTQKFVTLLDIFLDAFKGKGHCVTMDSAYMGDTMDQIGQEVQNGRDSPNESHGSSCNGRGTNVESGDIQKHFLVASDAKPLLRLRCLVGQ